MKKTIEIKDLNYSYPDGTKALENINLDISNGESVGIVGPNGAGKSTLLLHLNGILRGEGKVSVLGLDVDDKNLIEIRRNVGLVFQDPDNQLFMPTVYDDVAFGPINMLFSNDEVEGSVNNALKKVDMLYAKERSSHHLSLGEKKRVSIATVLSMSPGILALDEPSSNLDPKSRRDLIDLLKIFNHTKIIASHDLEFILNVCTRVIILDKGNIVANGLPKEIFSDEPLMKTHGLEVPMSLTAVSLPR